LVWSWVSLGDSDGVCQCGAGSWADARTGKGAFEAESIRGEDPEAVQDGAKDVSTATARHATAKMPRAREGSRALRSERVQAATPRPRSSGCEDCSLAGGMPLVEPIAGGTAMQLVAYLKSLKLEESGKQK